MMGLLIDLSQWSPRRDGPPRKLAMGTDYMAEAARHRHVAEEYRTIALGTSDEGLRGMYLRLADQLRSARCKRR